MKGIPFMRFYLDDVVIFSKTFEEHMNHISQVVERIAAHVLKVMVKECYFAQTEVALLGHIIHSRGVRVDTKKVKVIQDTLQPTSATELWTFLGIPGYYCRFIPSFVDMSAYLNAKTSMKVKFEWTAEIITAFKAMKKALTSPPVLAFPDFKHRSWLAWMRQQLHLTSSCRT